MEDILNYEKKHKKYVYWNTFCEETDNNQIYRFGYHMKGTVI